jgi:hypothetical protein
VTFGLGCSVSAEFRWDIGADLIFVETSSKETDASTLFVGSFLPLPEFGFYAQFNIGNFHVGPGLHGFSYVVYTGFWPTVYAEYDLMRFTFHAQLGGLLYGILDFVGVDSYYDERGDYVESSVPGMKIQVNKTLIPEISVWYRFGKFFRIGGGWVSIFALSASEKKIFDVKPQCYIGIKMSFPSAAKRMNFDGTQKVF